MPKSGKFLRNYFQKSLLMSFVRFRPEKSELKGPENIRLEQEKPSAPLTRLELPLNSPPAQFFNSQFQQPQFQRFPQIPEQQSLLQVLFK